MNLSDGPQSCPDKRQLGHSALTASLCSPGDKSVQGLQPGAPNLWVPTPTQGVPRACPCNAQRARFPFTAGSGDPPTTRAVPCTRRRLQPEPRPRLTPRKHRILTLFLKQLSDARQVFCGSEVLVTSISWDFLPFVVQHFRANFLRVKEKEKMDLIRKPTISMFPDIVEDRDAKSSKH